MCTPLAAEARSGTARFFRVRGCDLMPVGSRKRTPHAISPFQEMICSTVCAISFFGCGRSAAKCNQHQQLTKRPAPHGEGRTLPVGGSKQQNQTTDDQNIEKFALHGYLDPGELSLRQLSSAKAGPSRNCSFDSTKIFPKKDFLLNGSRNRNCSPRLVHSAYCPSGAGSR